MNKVAVLFVSHIINDDIVARYEKLRHELPPNHELFWAFDAEGGDKAQALAYSNQVRFFFFDSAMLNALGYTAITTTMIGSLNFVMQRFGLDHPEYDYYWIVEYDVVFTGNWHTLFADIDSLDADLVSTHIERYSAANWSWHWWHPAVWAGRCIPKERCIKSFNPIYRLSARGLQFMDTFLKAGNSGHYEMLMPTALFNHGYTLVDIGGYGEFTLPEFRNRYYISDTGINNGTIRYRPVYDPSYIRDIGAADKLFHPLK